MTGQAQLELEPQTPAVRTLPGKHNCSLMFYTPAWVTPGSYFSFIFYPWIQCRKDGILELLSQPLEFSFLP